MLTRQYFVYILSNISAKVLYVGVTNDLKRRVWEHKEDVVEGFTKKYRVHKLVYFETGEDAPFAIEREKQLKGTQRLRKWSLSKASILIGTTFMTSFNCAGHRCCSILEPEGKLVLLDSLFGVILEGVARLKDLAGRITLFLLGPRTSNC